MGSSFASSKELFLRCIPSSSFLGLRVSLKTGAKPSNFIEHSRFSLNTEHTFVNVASEAIFFFKRLLRSLVSSSFSSSSSEHTLKVAVSISVILSTANGNDQVNASIKFGNQ